MIDLTNYTVEIKKALTQEEFNKRIEKGIIRNGEIVEVYDNYGNIVKTKYVEIPPPMPDTIKYYEVTNWSEAKQLYLTHRDIWEKFKSKGQIPYDIVNKIENENFNK